MAPLVSIVIPAYRAAEFIGRAVASVQEQTLQDFEILIVDDASGDDTLATAQALAAQDARIRVFTQARNGGVAVARNTGIDQARGRYLAFLDADDALLPERLERLVALADAQALDVVGDNQWLRDVHLDRNVGVMAFNPGDAPMRLDAATFLRNSDNVPKVREILSGRIAAYFPVIKPIVRREFLQAHALRYDPACKIGEDFDLHIRCLLEGASVVIVPEAYYVYTLPYSEVSRTRSPHSRTVMNLQPVLRNVDHLLHAYRDRLSPELRRALARCKQGALGLQQFEQIKADLYGGRAAAVLDLATTPRLWGYAARSTSIKLRNLSSRLAS